MGVGEARPQLLFGKQADAGTDRPLTSEVSNSGATDVKSYAMDTWENPPAPPQTAAGVNVTIAEVIATPRDVARLTT